MDLISLLTLLATCGILLTGHRVYLFETSKSLNRAFFILSIFLFIVSFSIYEIIQNSDTETAMQFRHGMSLWPFVDCLIVFCLWRFSGLYKQVKPWKENVVWGVLSLIAMGLFYLEFFPETRHAELVFEKGQWLWVVKDFSGLDLLRGIWLYTICYSGILITYLGYRKSQDKKRKRLLKLVFITVSLGLNINLIQSWFLPSLGIPTNINHTFSSFFFIIFFAWIFTDFKLFEIKSTIAIDNIVNSMTNLMVLTNEYFQIQEINPATKQFFEIKGKDFINKPIAQLVEGIDWKYYETQIEQMDFQSDQFIKELTVNVNGEVFYLIVTVSPIINSQNKKTGYAFIGTDATEHKKAEQKIQSYNTQLKKSNEALERFAYITSHDLKEPLRTVGSFASLLERKLKPTGEVKEYIYYIMNGIERMNNLIESILEISKINKEEIQLMDIQVEDLLINVEEDLQAISHLHKINIQYENLPTIKGDKNQMYLLFQNLIENAVKYNNNIQPSIHVACVNKDGFYEFSVKDNGIGIAADYHEQVFKMFKRLHNQSVYKGTGVGLAICSKIVDLHKGKIWVESKEGEGADFKFTIPHQKMV